jgi:hypothetical protein
MHSYFVSTIGGEPLEVVKQYRGLAAGHGLDVVVARREP